MSLYALESLRIVAEGLDHPECVTCGPDGQLWAGGETGQVYRIDDAGHRWEEVGTTHGALLGVTVSSAQKIIVCDVGNHAVMEMDPRTGESRTLIDEVEGKALVNPNYAVFAPDGTLYISDSGHWHANDGYIFALDADDHVVMVDHRPAAFPNGLAYDGTTQTLYIVESTLPGITAIEMSGHTYRAVQTMEGTVPDGIALDQEGALYVGCYRPDVIYRIQHGEMQCVLEDPEGTRLATPTNLCFGGPENRTLYIASLGRWHISALEVKTPGKSLFYP